MSTGFDSVFPGRNSRTYVVDKVVGDKPFVDFTGKTLINVAYPTEDEDAANKKYVDDQLGGNSPWIGDSSVSPPTIEPRSAFADPLITCGSDSKITCGSIEAIQFSTPSDIIIKNNIEELKGEDLIAKLDKLRVIRYTSKLDSKEHIGLIAQELDQVFPEVVTPKEKEDDILRVNYLEIVPILLESIKNLNHRVQSLEEIINSRLKNLEDKVDQICHAL